MKEILAKSVLVKSKLTDYCVNPYSGCGHACKYCYVPKMPWNRGKNFADVSVKVNAAQVLRKELEKARKGTVMLSTACDAWQPAEEKYRVTRACLEALAEKDFPITVLTKSPLVTRDIDVLKKFSKATVGLTVSTDRDEVAALLEPGAPAVSERIEALAKLKQAGLETYAFIGPILPMNAAKLVEKLAGKIDFAFIDRLNYVEKDLKQLLEENNWTECASAEWIEGKRKELTKLLKEKGIRANVLF